MSIIDRATQYDRCVYWALKSNQSGELAYDDYGQPQHDDPIEIDCRWDDMAEEFIDPKGTRQTSKAVVLLRQVVDIGGMLFHGVLAAVTSPAAPRTQEDAWEIRQFSSNPNLRHKYYARQAFL